MERPQGIRAEWPGPRHTALHTCLVSWWFIRTRSSSSCTSSTYGTKASHGPRAISRQLNDGNTLSKTGKKWGFDDGTTQIVFEPLEFLEKLAALVPRPRIHLTRFHGVLGALFFLSTSSVRVGKTRGNR
ncbi:MAG: transposase [Bdellovibrionales bacterium]|jgi:hypothetical protein|nr:transposase [Bdellovibrionales bacterium]